MGIGVRVQGKGYFRNCNTAAPQQRNNKCLNLQNPSLEY